jgi:cytochrome P450
MVANQARPTDWIDRRPEKDEWDNPELMQYENQVDPYPMFARKRAEEPVSYSQGRDAYDVYTYDESVEVLTDWERFSNFMTSSIDGHLMDRDPPEHPPLRSMAADQLQPGDVREMRSQIEQRADDLLDAALADGREFDFVDEVAVPLPVGVIADILGVPQEKRDTFRKWSNEFTSAPPADADEETKERMNKERMRAAQNLLEFFDTELEKREENPQDDLITNMLRVEQESDLLSRSQTKANCSMLLTAGNVTTTTFMANALWTYAEEGIISDIQAGEIDLVDANEEVLRYRSPVTEVRRIATEDTEVGGVEIPEGSKMLVYLNSANRDEAVFEEPDLFRPDRPNLSKAIPFGKGIHFCIGAPLARLEAEIVLGKLLERVDEVELLEDTITPVLSAAIYGPAELPIRVSM